MTTHVEQNQTRSRRMIWILVALFFAPVAVAFLLYYGVEGWRPPGSTNHGDLVDPPQPLPQTVLQTPKGSELDTAALHGKWTLIYIGDGRCDERCREALTLMRQTRLALNDDMMRVQRLFLATGECCDGAYLQTEHAGLMTARAETGGTLLQIFARNEGEPVQQAGRIYIVDPLGNLMMSYEPQAGARDLLEDMKKLLKLSHIG